MYLRLLRRGEILPPDVTERTKALAGWPDAAAKAKSVVRALGVNWAVHVHSIETVGGMGDEFYGEQWLNPVSRPKFVHATDAAQTRLPANQAPGGKLGLVRFPNPTGALIFNLYIPGLFKKPISLADRPGGGVTTRWRALYVPEPSKGNIPEPAEGGPYLATSLSSALLRRDRCAAAQRSEFRACKREQGFFFPHAGGV